MTPEHFEPEPPVWLRYAGVAAILLSNLIGILTR